MLFIDLERVLILNVGLVEIALFKKLSSLARIARHLLFRRCTGGDQRQRRDCEKL